MSVWGKDWSKIGIIGIIIETIIKLAIFLDCDYTSADDADQSCFGSKDQHSVNICVIVLQLTINKKGLPSRICSV